MARPSREQIIAELDARCIAYSDDMDYATLAGLLKTETPVPMEPVKVVPPKLDEPIDVTKARCGLETIHDHERRLVLLERAMERLVNA